MHSPVSAPVPTPASDPYTTSVMSYADKVKQLLAQRAAPVAAAPDMGTAAPTVGTLPGTPPENPNQDNMTISARSGEYVFPEPAVKYYGVKKLEDMVHKAVEDINPPAQPAPEPPTQAQTFAKGGLINRKHFLRLPKGHAYDKMTPKKHPLKMDNTMLPTGMPPVPPEAMQMAPPQMAPPEAMGPPPVMPRPQGYFGGGLIYHNPDYWHGRNWEDAFNEGQGGSVHIFGGRHDWNPNTDVYRPDLPPISQPDYTPSPVQGLPQKRENYTGGLIGGYAGGGMVGRVDTPGEVFGRLARGIKTDMGGGSFRQMNQGLAGPWFTWAGPNQLGNIGPPNSPWFWQGPTMSPTTMGNSGYPTAIPVGPDYSTSYNAGLPSKKES